MHLQRLQQSVEHNERLVLIVALENLLTCSMVVLTNFLDARKANESIDVPLELFVATGGRLQTFQVWNLVVLAFEDCACSHEYIRQLFEVILRCELFKDPCNLHQLFLVSCRVVNELVDFFHCCLFN